jgi:hypothetical protein
MGPLLQSPEIAGSRGCLPSEPFKWHSGANIERKVPECDSKFAFDASWDTRWTFDGPCVDFLRHGLVIEGLSPNRKRAL